MHAQWTSVCLKLREGYVYVPMTDEKEKSIGRYSLAARLARLPHHYRSSAYTAKQGSS